MKKVNSNRGHITLIFLPNNSSSFKRLKINITYTYLLVLLTGLCSYLMSMKCIQGSHKIKMFSFLAHVSKCQVNVCVKTDGITLEMLSGDTSPGKELM